MSKPLAVLIVEDSESDAQIIVRVLKKADYAVVSERVETAELMRAALTKRTWDIVISDYALPQFDGSAALTVLRATGLDIPFIVVSGAIGEETAVAMMKAGAHDYVMKDKLNRLPAAVERELRETTVRRERKRAEWQVRKRVKELGAFYRLSEIDERQGVTLEEMYEEMANILPESWQYPEVACARMVISDREFRTANFAESPWMQVAQVKVNDCVVGKLEVGYLVEKPREDEGPFLEEERDLIGAIAQRLGSITARRQVEHRERVHARWAEAVVQLLQLPSSTETEILAFAVETLVALTESKLCFVGFVDGSETSMSGHLWSIHAMQECAVVGGNPVVFDVARGGLWTAPIRQHQAIIVNDYAAANPLKKGCPAGHVPLTRFLGVPLIREGRTVLVAGLANKVEDYSDLDRSETVVFLEGLWGVINRIRAANALQENNTLFTAFVRHSPIYAYIKAVTPTESRVLHSSENFCQMLGLAGSEEIRGKAMAELFPAEFAAKITADDWAVASGGEVLKLDEDLRGRNYTSIKFPIVCEGKILLAGYTIDITERKKAEAEIQQQLDELRRWQAVMLEREDRNMKLKREVNELVRRLGEPIRYPSQESEQ